MPKRIENIEIDLDKVSTSTRFTAKQYEDIELVISLINDGVAYDASNCVISLHCNKQIVSSISIENGKLIVIIASESLIESGLYECELSIADDNGTLKTPSFYFNISTSLSGEIIINAGQVLDAEGYTLEDAEGYTLEVVGNKVLKYTAAEIDVAILKVKNMPAEGIVGPKGDKGEQGIQGVPGIQGPKGDPGANGTFDKTTQFSELNTSAKDIPGAINENASQIAEITQQVNEHIQNGGGNIYIGDISPTDTNILLWIDTSGETVVSVSGVTLNKSTTTINIGSTDTLFATIAPSNATNKSVIWSSSNTGIATVNNGIVTGVANGTCTITCTTADGNKTATCSVTISNTSVAVTSITLNKSTSTLTVPNTEQLTVTFIPSNATNQNITWTSSNNSIATVSAGGLVTSVSAGSVTITATSVDGNKAATCNYTINTNIQNTIVTDGLQVYADFADGSNASNTFMDRSGNNVTITVGGFGMNVTNSGFFNGELNNNVITYNTCNVNVPCNLNRNTGYTLEGYFKASNIMSGYRISQMINGDVNTNFLWDVSNGSLSNQIAVNFMEKGYVYVSIVVEASATTTNNVKCYLDGVLVGQANFNLSGSDFNNITLFNRSGTLDRACTGSFRSFKVYGKALSEAEILKNYNYEKSVVRG